MKKDMTPEALEGTRMEYQYFVVRDHGTHPAYGIAVAVVREDCMYIHHLFQDICSDDSRIRALVHLCNQQKLSPLHLPEVIDDFLAE